MPFPPSRSSCPAKDGLPPKVSPCADGEGTTTDGWEVTVHPPSSLSGAPPHPVIDVVKEERSALEN